MYEPDELLMSSVELLLWMETDLRMM